MSTSAQSSSDASNLDQGALEAAGDQDAGVADSIGDNDALALRQFARKKAWIDDKIQFLKTLDAVDAAETPKPPERCSVTDEQLEAWFKEHDMIEAEVAAFDMGDMSRFKQQAKVASKQHLSSRDTDLIEITLVTLLAVDELLHLLRSRRKALKLMQYRLRWDRQIDLASSTYRSILAEIPSVIARMQSRHDDVSDSASSRQDEDPKQAGAELSVVVQAKQLKMVGVQDAALTLDRLIDSSSAPLPDAFLDEQDRLERSCGQLVNGLEDFFDQTRKTIDEHAQLRFSAQQATRDCAALLRQLQLMTGQTPNAEQIGSDSRSLDYLETLVQTLRARLRTTSTSPPLRHAALPGGFAINDCDSNELSVTLSDAEMHIKESSKLLTERRRVLYLCNEADTARAQLDELVVSSDAMLLRAQDTVAPAFEPDLDGSSMRVYAEDFEQMAAEGVREADRISSQLRQASSIVVQCNKEVATESSRRALKSIMTRASTVEASLRQMAQQRLDVAKGARNDAAALDVLLNCKLKIEERFEALRRAADAARWTSTSVANEGSHDGKDFEEAIPRSIRAALKSFTTSQADLSSEVAKCTTALVQRLDDLDCIVAVTRNLKHQSATAIAVLNELQSLQERVDALAAESLTAQTKSNLCSAQQSLQDDFDTLKTTVHARITFVAKNHVDARETDNLLGFELQEQDNAVRAAINERCASVAARLQDLKIDLNNHQQQSRLVAWDEAHRELIDHIDRLEEPAGHTQDVLATVRVAVSSLSAGLEALDPAVEAERRIILSKLQDRISSIMTAHDAHDQPDKHDGQASTTSISTSVEDSTSAAESAEIETASNTLHMVKSDTSTQVGDLVDESHDSPRALEDVFGSQPVPLPEHVDATRARLDDIDVDVWLNATAARRLPDTGTVSALQQKLDDASRELQSAMSSTSGSRLVVKLASELSRKQASLTNIAQLAAFQDKVRQADDALSSLLDTIDQNPESQGSTGDTSYATSKRSSERSALATSLLSAADKITTVRKAAVKVLHDKRVTSAVKRLEDSYAELLALADDVDRRVPSPPSSSASYEKSRYSKPGVDSSRVHGLKATFTNASSSELSAPRVARSSSASISGSTVRPSNSTASKSRSSLRPETDTPRRRVISEGPASMKRGATVPRSFNFATATEDLKSRSGQKQMLPPPLPMSRSTSAGSEASTRLASDLGRSLDSSSTVARGFSSNLPAPTPRRRSSNSARTKGEEHRMFTPDDDDQHPGTYEADPSRRVDVQIGKIVNELDLHVPIHPAEGSWNDESGMYWIGDAATGRLYFCRILRSIVMVRVGGGWLNLVTLITSHFASMSGVTISPRVSPTASLKTTSGHRWNDQLGASASATPSKSRRSMASALSASTNKILLAPASPVISRRSVSDSTSTPLKRPTYIATPRSSRRTSEATPVRPIAPWRP